MKKTTVTVAILASVATGELVWPSKWDELEDIYMMHSGYNRRGFIDAVNPCSFGFNIQGQHNAAEWIRTGFHDMATHNAEAGTGGIDASIFFELDRVENSGKAFNNTFGFMSGYYSVRASASDLIALGVITATAACGGATIPLRAGRIDAKEAGPAGVPEAHTDFQTTLARFETAGFSQEDMIAMVACGHVFGGVHSVDHPEIVEIPANPENDTSVPFQSDNSRFHNGVITEFLGNATKNPLVVANNDTFNSDKRIFESDGRKTMQQLANPEVFQDVCLDVFERMINTVPAEVQLSDVVEAYDVKPYVQELYLNEEGDLVFSGSVRLRTTRGVRDYSDVSLNLTFAGRDGKGETVITARQATFQSGLTSGLNGEGFVNFEFATTIPGETGISKFWIHETTKSTNETVTHDNLGTGGYPVQDTVLFQIPQSCRGDFAHGEFPITVTAMVREERAADPLSLTVIQRVPRQGVIVPELVPETVDFEAAGRSNSGWVAFEAHVGIVDAFTTFDIELGGEEPVAVDFQKTGVLGDGC